MIMKPMKLTLGALAGLLAVACLTLAGSITRLPDSSTQSPPPPATEGTSGSATWLTDFAAAQKQAKAGGKFMLLDFTGSDWCGWCMKLDREIFATTEFREFADKHLVLVKVDFPMHHPQSVAEKTQNAQLAERFQVQGYPTLVILDSDGHQAGTMGYMRGGPKPFIEKLAGMIAG
jgi:thioredoxin-related protein